MRNEPCCYNFAIMKLLALAVLLAVIQAAPPIPRKAPDNTAEASQKVKADSQDNQKQTSSSPALLKTDSNRPPERNNNQQRSDNAEHTVGISKLPPVSVTRDLADWGVWFFSLLLVIVGFLQVLLLRSTLRAIQRQADDMGRQVDLAFTQLRAMHEQITEMSAQTDVLEKSVAVAQQSANTARENFEAYIRKERAFVLIDKPSKPLQEMFDQSSDEMNEYFGLGYRHFRLFVRHYGPTEAFNIRVEAGKISCSGRTLETKPTEEVSFQNTLKPGDIVTSLLIWMNFTEEEEKDIESGDLSLHIFGRITYDDRFGIGRVTPFWYIWDQHASLVVPEANHWEEWHEWMFGGSPEDNQPT